MFLSLSHAERTMCTIIHADSCTAYTCICSINTKCDYSWFHPSCSLSVFPICPFPPTLLSSPSLLPSINCFSFHPSFLPSSVLFTLPPCPALHPCPSLIPHLSLPSSHPPLLPSFLYILLSSSWYLPPFPSLILPLPSPVSWPSHLTSSLSHTISFPSFLAIPPSPSYSPLTPLTPSTIPFSHSLFHPASVNPSILHLPHSSPLSPSHPNSSIRPYMYMYFLSLSFRCSFPPLILLLLSTTLPLPVLSYFFPYACIAATVSNKSTSLHVAYNLNIKKLHVHAPTFVFIASHVRK